MTAAPLGTRQLGTSAVRVTELSFGGAAIGNLFTEVSDEAAAGAVAAAWNGGIRTFDTAPHYGVTASVLVQTVTVSDMTPEMLALAATDPLVSAVVGWTDLTAGSVADDLAALASGPGGRYLAGIRHQVQSEARSGLAPPARRAERTARRRWSWPLLRPGHPAPSAPGSECRCSRRAGAVVHPRSRRQAADRGIGK